MDITLPDHISGLLIGGRWHAPEATLTVLAPAEGRDFAWIARGTAADVDRAVAAARQAFDSGWPALTFTERGRLLSRMREVILDHADELSRLEARDTGKPLQQARTDIQMAARYFEYYGGAADKLHGDTLPFLQGHFATTEYIPHGVTAHIIPWNYPAQMFPRSVAPALAVGNCVVMKPAEDACLVPLRMADLMNDAGFPAGTVNIVTGLGAEAGQALAEHRDIDFISFIGSNATGTLIQSAAARNNIGCTMELGGKSAQILFGDADLDRALPVIVAAITQHAGQTCSAGSRLLVEKAAWDKIRPRLVEHFQRVTVGCPEEETALGAVVSRRQRDRVERYRAMAKADGLPVIAEGRMSPALSADGCYVQPVAYGPVPRDHAIANEEVFGPVLAVIPFHDEEDAVALANATPYGLVAGIWTSDGARALRIARQMRVGQVFVNCYGAGGGIELPFGGLKRSGHGREKGFAALHEFSSLRTMVIRHD